MIQHAGFTDRRHAGLELALAIMGLDLRDPIVLALPRGGVPVGFEVAKALGAPLDVLMVRKIGAPKHEEYGIGAVMDGASPQRVIDEPAARAVGATPEYIEAQVARQLAEIERRRALYRPGPPVSVADRTVVVVDDGIATGGTVRAALRGLAKAGPAQVILAVPLAPAEVVPDMEKLCDRVICLASPNPFHAVGMHYRVFDQTSDEEVVRLLAEAKGWEKPGYREGGRSIAPRA